MTRSYADLDAHQKTILSDDFGMGVPIVWLIKHLPLVEIVDGRYFCNAMVRDMAHTSIARQSEDQIRRLTSWRETAMATGTF